jgi:hypothetical protein
LKNKTVLHISDSTLEAVKQILIEKFKDLQIFILNPSLNDLIQSNVYKLESNNVLYYVPLWHSELYFDADIMFRCIPFLQDNI